MITRTYLMVFMALSIGLSACNKKDDAKKAGAVENISERAVVVEPGQYRMAFDCQDKAKNEALPKLELIYDLKADGTYVESVKQLDPACEKDCEGTVRGTYQATEGTFSFTQQSLEFKNSNANTQPADKKVLDVIGYVKEKGQIVLVDPETDNACDGKMLVVLQKNP